MAMPAIRINVFLQPFPVNLTNKRHGKLFALDFNLMHPRRGLMWLVRCDCGTEKFLPIGNWGDTRSCGCLQPTFLVTPELKRLAGVLKGMKQRCFDEGCEAYAYYGARGITVCDEWMKDSFSFYNWALANGYQIGLQIDRRDNYKGYEPGNCRFVTRKENMNNLRFHQDRRRPISEAHDIHAIAGLLSNLG